MPNVTFLGIGEEGKALGIPKGLSAGPMNTHVFLPCSCLGFYSLNCLYSSLWALDVVFAAIVSLGGESTLIRLSRVYKVKAGLSRSQGQCSGFCVSRGGCHVEQG